MPLLCAGGGFRRVGQVGDFGEPLVRLDLSVAETDDPAAAGADLVFVGHQNNCAPFAVEPVEQVENFERRDRVEVAGRLVGQNEVRVVNERTGDGDPLLLAAGKLGRPVAEPVPQTDHLRQFDAPLAGF